MAKTAHYDSADWHYDKKFVETGLPDQHSAHHILYFQRWLHERDALTDAFWEVVEDGPRVFPQDFRSWGDIEFLDYMVKPEWRPFVDAYYSSEYKGDYVATLQGELPSLYHIPFTDEGGWKLKVILDERYAEWQEKPDRWEKPRRQTVAQRHPRTFGALATVGFILLLVVLVVVVGKLFDLVERAIQGTVFQVPVTILVLALMGWGVWAAFRKKA